MFSALSSGVLQKKDPHTRNILSFQINLLLYKLTFKRMKKHLLYFKGIPSPKILKEAIPSEVDLWTHLNYFLPFFLGDN